jgi:hypothetical protein
VEPSGATALPQSPVQPPVRIERRQRSRIASLVRRRVLDLASFDCPLQPARVNLHPVPCLVSFFQQLVTVRCVSLPPWPASILVLSSAASLVSFCQSWARASLRVFGAKLFQGHKLTGRRVAINIFVFLGQHSAGFGQVVSLEIWAVKDGKISGHCCYLPFLASSRSRFEASKVA